MKNDPHSSIDYLRSEILRNTTDKAIRFEAMSTTSLSILRQLLYSVTHKLNINHEKLKK